MLDRVLHIAAAFALALMVLAFIPTGSGAQLADTGYGSVVQMEVSTGGSASCPGCPDDDEQSRQACSGGACPSALLSGGPPPALAPRPITYEVLQERHKTPALKPELGPPRALS